MTNPLFHSLTQQLVGELVGRPVNQSPELQKLEQAKELARRGNWFPYIGMQWPHLIVEGADRKYFREHTGGLVLRLDDWQCDILNAYADDTVREVFIKGNTKAGKGASTAIAANVWFDIWPECKIILTSVDHKHAVDGIFGEMVAWRTSMQFPQPGKILSEGISDHSQHYAFVRNPQFGEGFSGQHGPRTLFLLDEASGIREELYKNLLKQFNKLGALSNPRTLFGWYRSAFNRCPDPDVTTTVVAEFGKRACFTISADQCLNVREKRLERPVAPPDGIEADGVFYAPSEVIPQEVWQKHFKPLIPDQVDYSRYIGLKSAADPNDVRVFCDGKFPKEDREKQIILQSWLPTHTGAWSPDLPVECFGFDVARSKDGDLTTFAAGGLAGVRALHTWQVPDTTFHADEAIRIALEEYGIDLKARRTPVVIDCDGGYGAGVLDILTKMGVWCIEFHGSARAMVDPRHYGNARAEAYGLLGRRLDPADRWTDQPWALLPDEQLLRELCAPEKLYGRDGIQWKATPKSLPPGAADGVVSVKEKLGGKSPDKADAVVYLFAAVRLLHRLDAMFLDASGPMILHPHGEESEKIDELNVVAWIRGRYGVGGRAERQRDDDDWERRGL